MTNRSYAYTLLQNSADFPTRPQRNGSARKLQNQNSSCSDEEVEFSPTKLRRNKSGISVQSALELRRDLIDHVIQAGETLQGIALQYRCTVFDLKRVNNIVNDTEFFAFRVLKIPVVLHSSLTQTSMSPQSNEQRLSPSKIRMNLVESPDFLQQVDEDLQKLKEKARVYEIQTELRPDDFDHQKQPARKKMDCRGDDCGLSWTQLVGLALLVLLACPLLYFLHLELEKHGSASTNSSSVSTNGSLPS